MNQKIKDNYYLIGQFAISNRIRTDYLDISGWIQSKEDFKNAKLLHQGYQDYQDTLACWIRYEKQQISIILFLLLKEFV